MGDEPVSVILSRVCHTRLSDTTSGFKLYGPRALSLFAHNYPGGSTWVTRLALSSSQPAPTWWCVRSACRCIRVRAVSRHTTRSKSALFLVRATLALTVALTRPGEKIAQAEEENA